MPNKHHHDGMFATIGSFEPALIGLVSGLGFLYFRQWICGRSAAELHFPVHDPLLSSLLHLHFSFSSLNFVTVAVMSGFLCPADEKQTQIIGATNMESHNLLTSINSNN